ncbi:E3 ubiquitin-protein ligase ZNF598-like isoform X2 [Ornithodoros turicata]|uniref:E3 ubiquitin-protein ligase ZNF598-like isoform X2 n=1 Tax=Ornithodoros turicata TaxID=34597 RepID=UPI003138C909
MDVKEDDNVCIVCWREINVYAVGLCDHPVCHECSTRMRVLCKKSECPICRRNLPKVIFVKTIKPYEQLNERLYTMDPRPQICFETEEVRKVYRELLENRCKYCPPSDKPQGFINLHQLSNHIRKEHRRAFCNLCVEHLKIFPRERTAYSKKELARHLQSGDVEDTSHRGHPLCQFCNVRYFDNDELYRHLRREHYFCHFCGDDYRLQYYRSYEFLREHFRKEHFLCEEGDCKNETFTAAFRSEIDLKAHKAQQHSKTLSKAQAKQARTLELEFTITPRNRADYEDGRRRARNEDRDEQAALNLLRLSSNRPIATESWETQQPVDYRCEKEFPQLGGQTTTVTLVTTYPARRTERVDVNSVEEFPSLNPSSTPRNDCSVLFRCREPKVSIRNRNGPEPKKKESKKSFEEEFPTLSSRMTHVSSATLVPNDTRMQCSQPQGATPQPWQQNGKPKKEEAKNPTEGTTQSLLQLISEARKETPRQQVCATFTANDFPTLNGGPPPGFTAPRGPPPPGFSGGQPEKGPKACAEYTQPAGFAQRNLRLIQDVQRILGDNFMKFKQLSGAFRRDAVSAEEYFSQCVDLFGGEEEFAVVFPELLFLLPDIGKQQELVRTYNVRRRASGALPKNSRFLVCATCQQVLSGDDFRTHTATHS